MGEGTDTHTILAAQRVENPPADTGDPGSISGSGRSPRGDGNATPVFLPGEAHGQRSLLGYSPWGPKRVRHNLRY